MHRTVLAMMIAVVLAACSTSIPTDKLANIRRIGIVSFTADVLTWKFVGVTVFGNEEEAKQIEGWGIDRSYEGQLGAIAATVFSAVNVPISYDRSELAHIKDRIKPFDPSNGTYPNYDAIAPFVRSTCDRYTLDALLVVAGYGVQERPDSNQVIFSAGIIARRGSAALHLVSHLALLECATAKSLAIERVGRYREETNGNKTFVLPYERLPHQFVDLRPSKWTEEAETLVRNKLLEFPKDQWEDSLRRMLPGNKIYQLPLRATLP